MPSNLIDANGAVIVKMQLDTITVGGITRMDAAAFYDSNGVKVVGNQVGGQAALGGGATLADVIAFCNGMNTALKSHGLTS